MNKLCFVTIVFTFHLLIGCASYQYEISDTKIPVSFSYELGNNEKFRHFSIETKLSWYLFDTQPISTLDLDDIFRNQLPNAKKIFK
ncbi:hypothetical protein [Leptospira meyeri]|uniref:hypothetical protein n=1 Tax=Leptospira meyeri TaxID=29508 RepID=UPI001EFA15EE|nr:hypothetical protein [Leptospira meyeri]